MILRLRRPRQNKVIRDLTAETRLSADMLVYPVFIREGRGIVEDIPSLSGQKRCSPDTFPRALGAMQAAGVSSVLLFGLPEHKDETGTGAWNEDGVIQQSLRIGKREFPHVNFIGDVCMCEYTSHDHRGILHGTEVDNDETLTYVTRIAVSQTAACLKDKIIFSYAVKYASAFYGPFRDAAGSAPAFGDRRAYQMDPRNAREAFKETVSTSTKGPTSS